MGDPAANSFLAAASAAMDENERDYVRFCAARRDNRLRDDEEMLWQAEQAPNPALAIQRAVFAPDRADAAIQEAVADASARGLPLSWRFGPDSLPDDLGARLEAHGFRRGQEMVQMALDLSRPAGGARGASPGPSLERVTGGDAFRDWAAVMAATFGLPAEAVEHSAPLGLERESPQRHYLVRQGGEALAAATFFLSAGVASLYYLGTMPAARRQGLASALVLAGLEEARGEGYRLGAAAGVRAENEGALAFYRRLGFHECSRVFYYHRPTEQQA